MNVKEFAEKLSRRVATLNPELPNMNVQGKATENGDYMIHFYRGCTIESKEYRVIVNLGQVNKWVNGDLMQVVMPDLTKEERGFIKFNVTPAEWKKYVGL